MGAKRGTFIFSFRRFYAIFSARNKEYFRDRAAFGWNILFPFLIIFGFGMIFQRGAVEHYKIGVIHPPGHEASIAHVTTPLRNTGLLEPVFFADKKKALDQLRGHRLDLVLDPDKQPPDYWISAKSPKSKIAESLVLTALADPETRDSTAKRKVVPGRQLAYIDWLFPGILAMNAMFSALFGVGYVIVRYRKNGVLKRLKATPVTAFEYLLAQVVSRIFLLVFSGAILYVLCAVLFGFTCRGSYLDLILFFSLGGFCLISIGLVVATRTSSEEFANGLLNMISWPMMFLSEVWFSLEGANPYVQSVSRAFPLTRMTHGMRQIMNQGAGLVDVLPDMAVLAAVTAGFMIIGSALFKWTDG